MSIIPKLRMWGKLTLTSYENFLKHKNSTKQNLNHFISEASPGLFSEEGAYTKNLSLQRKYRWRCTPINSQKLCATFFYTAGALLGFKRRQHERKNDSDIKFFGKGGVLIVSGELFGSLIYFNIKKICDLQQSGYRLMS